MKDWIGNQKSTFIQLGASNHTYREREINDFYATDPHALEIFLDKLKEDGICLHENIWECACGMGHLSKVLERKGYYLLNSDIVDRGYSNFTEDFLKHKGEDIAYDILTNPPYKYAKEFVEHALDIQAEGYYTVMFLKIQFLEGQARKELFKKYPPKYIYVNSARQTCYINGDMSKKMSSASCYCWYIWQKGFKNEPIVRWI